MKAIWDGAFRLVEVDSATGRSTWVRHNDDGSMTYRFDYPVADIVKVNEWERNETAGKPFGEWVRWASIPMPVYYGSGYADAVIQDDKKWISRWLNNSDNRAWRTREGKA